MKEKASPWFRVLALCIAVGLGGAYVWRQQQKAAPQKTKTDERRVLSSSKSAIIGSVAMPAAQEEPDRILMPSSKSGTFKSGSEVAKERALLPSSKSIPMPIFRQRSVVPEDPPKLDKP